MLILLSLRGVKETLSKVVRLSSPLKMQYAHEDFSITNLVGFCTLSFELEYEKPNMVTPGPPI